MARNNRDDFTDTTKLKLAKQAGWLCSDPSCRRPTIGSTSDGKNEINLGTAAHICAAAPGGPRYDPKQTREQRRSDDNGIWMCKLHGTAVDAKDSKFTVELLREWKTQAQIDSWKRVLYGDVPRGPAVSSQNKDDLSKKFRTAAIEDLNVFRRSERWPSTTIPLTLEVDGLSDPVSTSSLATALLTLDDLILVAPPGMGKTTTLFQIAESLLIYGNALPIVVPLGDWSTDSLSLFEFVLKRQAYQGVSEENLRMVASEPGVTLMLDGWNELDIDARKRLTVQVTNLQAELPQLGLLISTRKQALDVPVNGTRINLLPLSESQQLDIAEALRGDAGVRIVDQAWRVPGVRELVTIPLYLTSLLSLPENKPFPVTKEEILRRFVAVHEENAQRAEALMEALHGFHHRFLEELAACATHAMNTTITDTVARKSISDTENKLVEEGQITIRPQPNIVLEALVSYHVLLRIGDPAGYSFQHQQFQEWYASNYAEPLMLASVGNIANRDKLKAKVLNIPIWEEATLFACERLARGDENQQEACGETILAAFEVDPMLAAEIIFRSTDLIWARVGSTIQRHIEKWHKPGTIDRAFHFMISTGRPEFFDQVWPLITHENDQIHLEALRAGRQFRPSILGNDAAKRIATLPSKVRENVLHEIVFNSGIEGLNLATTIAKDNPDPEIKATVVGSLEWRRADQHIADVLRTADEKTFDMVVRKDLVRHITDEQINNSLEAARERQQKQGGISTYEQLNAIIHAQGEEDLSSELTSIIGEMKINIKDKEEILSHPSVHDAKINLLYIARTRYPQAIADGLLVRVRTDRELFRGAEDFVTSADLILEEEELLEIALSNLRRGDIRAETAASVLGPKCVGQMIKQLLSAKNKLNNESDQRDQTARDRYYELLERIRHTPGTSLIKAIYDRSSSAKTKEMRDLAELISRHPGSKKDSSKPFDKNTINLIGELAEDWGNRMLASEDATRFQLASIAELIALAPLPRLLGIMKLLLDEELSRYRAFLEEAIRSGWSKGQATNEARTIYTNVYQKAFQAINDPETDLLMKEYLQDMHFGETAAKVLAARWIDANEHDDSQHFQFGTNFSKVKGKREERANNPSATSDEAETIFSAIEQLIADETTEEQKNLAVSLGIVAALLPHGQRETIINKLIALAPRRSRAKLLQNLIASGEIVDNETVTNGIAEVFEAAKEKSWILMGECYELTEWLDLLPFVDSPSEVLAFLHSLPEEYRRVARWTGVIIGFGYAPGDDAENILFQLAEDDPNLYTDRMWQLAVIRRGTLSAARYFLDLTANGIIKSEKNDWRFEHHIKSVITEYPELRAYIYQLLQDSSLTSGLEQLVKAVAEVPDVEGLILLTKIAIEHKRSFISRHTIEKVVTEHIHHKDWKGSYEIVSIPAAELRRKLLALTTDGGPTDIAARYLNMIDEIRDEYGLPDSEPRHPDLESGKQWPIMVKDTDMYATE